MKHVFVTGTDTDAGKTFVSVLLLKALNRLNYQTIGFKPIAAGCERRNGMLENADALALQSAASVELPYDKVNPISFEPPIAPHIAAQLCGETLSLERISRGFSALKEQQADFLLVEGAGGWRLPLSLPSDCENAVYLSDWVAQQKIPVILVVGMKLGCLNHALLSYEQIKRDGLEIVGWVANQMQNDMLHYQENLATLKAAISEPMLAEVKYQATSLELLSPLL